MGAELPGAPTSPSHKDFQEWSNKPEGFWSGVGYVFKVEVRHVTKEFYYPGRNSSLQKISDQALEWFEKGELPEGDLFENIKNDK